MRRCLALLLLLVTTVTGTPAAAQVGDCDITEQVYGITGFGDLVVQPFCVMPGSGYLPSRTLAAFGTDVPRLFYGGQLADNRVIIYGVDAGGALLWYRENSVTGQLDPGVVIGSQFGDWREYQHLQTIGNGDLSGVDAQGRLWRWWHLGWKEGTDTWAAGQPEDAGMTCVGARPVFAGRYTPALYVGVTEKPPSYVYCGHDGSARVASLLPKGVEAVTMAAAPGVSYALRQADSRLTRMILDTSGETPQWRADAVARPPFLAVFAGRSIFSDGSPPPFKYEWQWPWYGTYP